MGWGGGYPIQGLMVGGTPSQVWMVGGYPIPGVMVGEVPNSRSDGGGGTPSQVWWLGVPGVSPWLDGVPQPGRNGGGTLWYPPTMTGWGNPHPHIHHDWMGYPHHDWIGYHPPPSIASTCYAVGGMPLVFTQEDFLVKDKIIPLQCCMLTTIIILFILIIKTKICFLCH